MNVKKIVAREGLIFIFVLSAQIIICVLANTFASKTTEINGLQYEGVRSFFENITLLPVFGYSLYWVIRFIIWAIKTLRAK